MGMGFGDFLGDVVSGGFSGMIGGSNDLADAETAAGNATLSATAKAITEQEARRTENIALATQYGSQSWGELSSINTILADKTTALNASLSSLQQQQAKLDAVDPVVKSASSNLQDLLAGKQAALLGPLQKVIDRQEAELKNNLAGQLGSGWMSSSAGIEAMTKFQESSAVTLGTAQMNALTQASNIFSNAFGQQMAGQQSITQGTIQAYNQAQTANAQVLQANQLDASRQSNAVMAAAGTPVDYMAAANAAGLPWAGAIQGAQSKQQMGAGFGGILFGAPLTGNNMFGGQTKGGVPLGSLLGKGGDGSQPEDTSAPAPNYNVGNQSQYGGGASAGVMASAIGLM